MLKSQIESILNSPSSLGNLGAMLCFSADRVRLREVHNDLMSQFRPEEVVYSSFDLDRDVMRDLQVENFFEEKSNSILRVILVKGRESIIVDYYKDQVSIEHLFRPTYVRDQRGYSVIGRYLSDLRSWTLVIGYELSVSVKSFEVSLRKEVLDKGLHPIVVVRKDETSDCLIEEYPCSNTELGEYAMAVMSYYLELLGIDWKPPKH